MRPKTSCIIARQTATGFPRLGGARPLIGVPLALPPTVLPPTLEVVVEIMADLFNAALIALDAAQKRPTIWPR